MLYITGDTHGDLNEFRARINGRGLGKGDILLITGDFGFDWNTDLAAKWCRLKKDYTVLFCDGNHENFDLLETLPQKAMFGDVVGDFGNDTYRLLTGHMYTIEGFRTFVFGGARSIDRAVRRAWIEWWPQEIPSKAQIDTAMKTLEENGWKFDLFISHTCTPEMKKKVGVPLAVDFYDPVEKMLKGLEEAIEQNGGSWGSSWFGHFHKDANMDGRYRCRYQGVSRILSRDSYEPARKHKKDLNKEIF